MQCEVWSVECEDFASSLAEKKTACRGKDTVGTGFSSNYRSFIFGKLPPPACPGTCVYIYIWQAHGCRHFHDSHFLTVYTLLSTL